MIKIENIETYGWEAAIRGMRNPMNSWDKSDSIFEEAVWRSEDDDSVVAADFKSCVDIGENDLQLMRSLAKAGPVHAKYRRMLTITMDITAPLYWWKEFDTYKVGTVANSCSTMHKIHAKEFTMDDFSHEHLLTTELTVTWNGNEYIDTPLDELYDVIGILNACREKYLETKDKRYWWQIIQLLPSSYNQKRTVQLNYEVAHNIYISRKDHKLNEWVDLCKILEILPFAKGLIYDVE